MRTLRVLLRTAGLVLVTAVVLVPATGTATALATTPCALGPGGSIHHVVYLQFDNVHLQRDIASVPSDLEQMPALKSFLTSNGTLLSNDHTILISHTAGGILASLTGLYPDRNGLGVSNSYGVFHHDGSLDTSNASAANPAGTPAFTYWTDPVSTDDTLPNLVTTGGKNTPAPWVPYTRAGCDVGAFSLANMELENTKTTPSGDITKVFGSGSPEFNFANDAAVTSGEKVTDFEGIAVHCSSGDSLPGGLCGPAHGGKADTLPDEPGGYSGYNALFGGIYANQVVDQPGGFQMSGTSGHDGVNDLAPVVNDVYDFTHTVTPVTCTPVAPALACPATKPVADTSASHFNGFPGFNPSAAQTLGYVAAMQESGIPVTFSYVSDLHDDHDGCNGGVANGPGNACYEQQLGEYNQAFSAFFQRLAADGIDKSNTLFVITVEEGDHFAGAPPTNAGTCDGVHVPCTYGTGTTGPNTVGEIDVNLQNALAAEAGDTTPFSIHNDDAPNFYVPNAPNGPPTSTDAKVRHLEQEAAALVVTNPRTSGQDVVTQHIADQLDEGILHMANADPLRTPSFTLFGDPDYFYENNLPVCTNNSQAGCPVVGPGFAWNHGDDNPEIAKTWLGLVGPDVQNLGQTGAVWTDHTDFRPTMLSALGLRDSYEDDGNPIAEVLTPAGYSTPVQTHLASYEALAGALKQLNSPFGDFGHDSEIVSTTAVSSVSPGDVVYNGFDHQLAVCKTARDALAGTMQAMLSDAAFNGGSIDDAQAGTLTGQAYALIGDMHRLSQDNVPPADDVCAAGSGSGGPGTPGPAGPAGPAGQNGVNGVNGTNGAPGAAGAPGQNGINGAAGPAGAPGAPGPSGKDGKDGANGKNATVTCKATGTKRVKVTCKVTYPASSRVAREMRIVLLTRAGKIAATARTVHAGHVRLVARRKLVHGRTYVLTIASVAAGVSKTLSHKAIRL